MMDWSRVLFVGWGDASGVTHYRTILPANQLGAEYVVFDMHGTGVARSGARMKHDVIVMQHGWEQWQLNVMRKMKASGAIVLVNVDDWLKGLGKLGDKHSFSATFSDKKAQLRHLSMLREADGVLCSTEWLVDKCLNYADRVFLAENGLDLARYERWSDKNHPTTSPPSSFVFGWAGGTGHLGALRRIVEPITAVLRANPHVEFHMVGANHSNLFPSDLKGQLRHEPWADMAFYPRYISRFDVSLAPAEENDFYRAKSQLRFYEACAMGVPTIGHPMYTEIRDSVTGYIATDWLTELMSVVSNPELVDRMSSSCLDYAQDVSIERRITGWKTAIETMSCLEAS